MKRESRILLSASIICNFAFGLFGPLYAIFAERVGGDILSVSGAWAVFALVNGTLTIAFGRMGDRRLNKRLMVFAGYCILAFGSLGYFFVETAVALFMVQAILGLGNAIIEPAWDALYSMFLERGRESFQWSLWSGGTNIVLAAAAVCGGIIVTLYDFKALFLLMFGVNMVSAFIALRILK
jgi:MFS family permease